MEVWCPRKLPCCLLPVNSLITPSTALRSMQRNSAEKMEWRYSAVYTSLNLLVFIGNFNYISKLYQHSKIVFTLKLTQLTLFTSGFWPGGQCFETSLCCQVVSLDLKLCTTFSLFLSTPFAERLGNLKENATKNENARLTLRWTSIPFVGEKKYSRLLHAIKNG